MPDKNAAIISDEFDAMFTKRSTWESHWRLVADAVSPVHNFEGTRVPGEKMRQRMYDSTAADASERLSAALHSLATSASIRWFELHHPDEDIDRQPPVRKWMRTATTTLLKWIGSAKSGFNVNIAEVYADLVTFGTAAMFIKEELEDNAFIARPLSEIFLRENDEQMVDAVYRLIKLTARQAVQRWGPMVGPKVLEMAMKGGADASRAREYIHAVYHRDEVREDIPSPENKPWASLYVDRELKMTVSVSGFNRMPYVTPRWRKYTGEIYGRGPGMVAMPEAMMMNSMQRSVLIAAEKAIDPPLAIPYDGFISPLKTQPGGLNYKQPGSSEDVQPIVAPRDFRAADLQLEKREEKIRLMFLQDMLSLPMQDRMTAEEVAQRRTDRMQLMSPVLFRLESELLSPIVERSFEMLDRHRKFPEKPGELAGSVPDIEYVSPLALAQRASESGNIQRALSVLMPFIQGDPRVLQNFDTDFLARKMWLMHNNDPAALRAEDDVVQIREQQAQAEQAAQAAATAVDAGRAAKDFAGVNR